MEINKRYFYLKNALASLKKTIDVPHSAIYEEQIKDSLVQRFEYTIEVLWKYLSRYLESKYGVVVDPEYSREVLKRALKHEIISEVEFYKLVEMIAERNQTSHMYNEKVARQIVDHIYQHYDVLRIVIDRINPKE